MLLLPGSGGLILATMVFAWCRADCLFGVGKDTAVSERCSSDVDVSCRVAAGRRGFGAVHVRSQWL